MRCRALEAHHALSLGVTVGHVVRVVADVFLSSVGQALVARGLIGHTMGALTVVTVSGDNIATKYGLSSP